jgi:ATP-dependent Lon protease
MTDSLFPDGGDSVLPILPLRNSVLFPVSVVPVNVGRHRSVRLIETACGGERPVIAVVAQKRAETEDPGFDDVHWIGTVARVLKVIRLGTGQYSVVLQGVSRMRILEPLGRHPCLTARVERIHEPPAVDVEFDALTLHLRESTRALYEHLPSQPREAARILDNVVEPGALADLVTANVSVSNDIKQAVLETLDVRTRLRTVIDMVDRQREVFRVKREISNLVQEEMSRSQRELLLRQQLKRIKQELGEPTDDEDDLESLSERVAMADMPQEADKAARQQLRRMRLMNSASSEYHVARAYVEWLADLPWSKSTPDRLHVGEARRVLDEDHHGLERPKRRIVEYVAVRRLRRDGRAPILCFVGPPGVGKTSLARSIAHAAGREFVRVSLGGVSDEAEIRGHRRTYVGAFPGRIVAGLKKAKSRNPVIVLDEIDKLGRDQRGDPGSALLEVLDPEQNHAFVDHYLEVPVDLSSVMFIATANRMDTIPGPLLDRMEVIELPGYTLDEKRNIAARFIMPRQLSDHGLTPERLELSAEALDGLIEDYTDEAGVRRLEQQIAALCRAVAVRLAKGEDVHLNATMADVKAILGPPRGGRTRAARVPAAGHATALAYSPSGGRLMMVEATRMAGTGKLQTTGSMGDVMRESVAAALTYVRSRASTLGVPDDFLSKIDVHVHLPEGAVPKEGASAGVALYVAMATMLTRQKVRTDVGMAGEITLRGNVLRIGGVKERCLIAHREGLTRVVLPARNAPDLEEVPKDILDALDIQLVNHVDEVLALVCEPAPVVPLEASLPA